MVQIPTCSTFKEADAQEIEELLKMKFWTEKQFKVLADFLKFSEYERQQALWAVPIETLLARMGISFPAGKHTPQIRCFLPDHADSTASMTLYRRTNTCYCFGCRQRLNTIDVLVKLAGYSYGQAMDYLLGDCLQTTAELLRRHIRERFRELRCNRDRLPIRTIPTNFSISTSAAPFPSAGQLKTSPEKFSHQPQNEYDNASNELNDRAEEVQQILRAAVDFYQLQLDDNPEVQQYLSGRGLTETAVDDFKLGYACGLGLTAWLRNQMLDIQLADKLGITGKDGSERLAGRVIVPIFDREGHLIQLTGRVLAATVKPDEWAAQNHDNAKEAVTEEEAGSVIRQQPKYLHLRLPKPHLNRFLPAEKFVPCLLLVEGPFDYLLACQWGYSAACAFGTNVSSYNIAFLKEAIAGGKLGQLVIAFDNDPDRLLPEGRWVPGPGPQAAHKLLAELATPKATILKLPEGFKDIASLGESGQGETLLAQSVGEARLPGVI